MTDSKTTKHPQGLMDVDGRLKDKVALSGGPTDDPSRVTLATLGRIGPAIVVVILGTILPFVVPGLESYRPWKDGDPVPFWNVLGRPFEAEEIAEAEERAGEAEELAQEVLAADTPEPKVETVDRPVIEDEGDKLPPYKPHPEDAKEPVRELELFNGDELDRFYTELARSDAGIKGAVTNVVHYGDSAIGIDGIPGAIRTRMQNRFGNSGHGFHLMAQPNSSYRHREVEFNENGHWGKCFIIFKCADDGRYGLGGTIFRSWGGAQSSFAPHKTRSAGKVSRFEVFYMAAPEGGRIRLRVDKGEKTFIETANDTVEDRFHTIEVEDGYHSLEVRAAGEGRVRIYGVTLDRDVPGVVWDSLSQIGAFTSRMGEFDEEHLGGQLARRDADLVVLTFGGNDMIRNIKMSKYTAEYREVIQKIRRARPEMDCLVTSPLDHAQRKGVRIVSLPVVPKMVEAQREAAKAEGCAFFDTYSAMGGKGAAGRWFRRKPRLISGDLSHATGKGHQVIGEMVFRALVHGYVAFRERTK